MTNPTPKAPPYPKSHILAASGVAALLSLALLVFPSREVEAQKTFINLDLGNESELLLSDQDLLAPQNQSDIKSPFNTTTSPSLASDAQPEDKQQNAAKQSAEHSGKQSVKVGNGETLSVVFNKVGLSANDLHEVINSSKEVRQFTRLKVGQTLDFKLSDDGKLQSMQTKISELETIRITRTDKGFKFERDKVTPTVTQVYTRGVISSSLFLSAKRAGLSHNLTMELANIFGYDIDFALDIREGDEFEVLYEEKVVNGKHVGTGNILSARFTNKGKTYSAVRYTTQQGSTSYYNANGDSMRKAFIRTPVDFARISSRFSTGRKHPILNKIRAHKGVDYAAPRGTPIKAAGDGRVVLAGRNGGYGNTVIIQHGQRYRTLYAHMNGFAKGIRNGANVKQGQIIGYIGTTGLSTGPHLHYEFQVNGVHVDPLSQKVAMADPIPAREKARFLQLSKPLMARMDQEKTTMLALNKR